MSCVAALRQTIRPTRRSRWGPSGVTASSVRRSPTIWRGIEEGLGSVRWGEQGMEKGRKRERGGRFLALAMSGPWNRR